MHEKIIDFFSDFTVYLQDAGFPTSESEVARLIRSVSKTEIDITDEEEILSAMTVCLAKTREQVEAIRELFSEYIKRKLAPQERKKQEEKKKKEKDALDSFRLNKEEEIKKLTKEKDDIEREVISKGIEIKETAANKKLLAQFSKIKSEKFPAREREIFRKVKCGETVLTLDLERLFEFLMKRAEQDLFKGRMDDAKEKMDAAKYAKQKALDQAKGCAALQADILKAQRDVNKKIAKLEAELRDEQKRYDAICAEINNKLKELSQNGTEQNNGLKIKDMSVLHRAEFHGGGSVQALDPAFVKAGEKDFKKLSEQEKKMIRDYLRQNLLAFKTRMTRNINSRRRLSMDIEDTLREAVRTCALPMKLLYKLPKRSKADLILILDVSGSCKAASEMMLTFIGILKEIFPRGCSAFAFVNQLYDISRVYDTADIDTSIKEVLNMIPRAGQYSNYERPLRTMWEQYRNKITKDSCVIFIGDARNNKNDAGKEYIKNICRKAKCAYWLNTDTHEKWDHGDSIASVYGKYAKMYETINVNELLGFISEMR